mmetsp:Transcript_18550/g.18630  ORF Transcript_18550/g.18630 Transcript_18550/m.18630 type:complete len:119 (+) Transcript_18550:68-424(+)
MYISIAFLTTLILYFPIDWNSNSFKLNNCVRNILKPVRSTPSSANNITIQYTDKDLRLKGSNLFSVKLPSGVTRASFSEKEMKTIAKKESVQANETSKSDLEILKEEIRLLVEKMAEN